MSQINTKKQALHFLSSLNIIAASFLSLAEILAKALLTTRSRIKLNGQVLLMLNFFANCLLLSQNSPKYEIAVKNT